VGQERKTAVSHTVLAAARLGPRAYASSGLRQAFANPAPQSPAPLIRLPLSLKGGVVSKTETSFWGIFVSGVISSFLGVVLVIIFYPSLKQFFGEYARYGLFLFGPVFSVTLFLFLRRYITLCLVNK